MQRTTSTMVARARAVCAMLIAASAAGAAAAPAKPHVLMAVVDDLGWNDVGWHDQFGQIQTPKLDKLIKTESIELTNYYVYRFCSPSRSTFMTGRYPWHIGQQTRMNLNPTPGIACGINLKYDFLPKVLKQSGYEAWALGKWHLGFLTDQYTPTYRGFDRYLGYYSGAEEHFTHLKSGAGVNHYDLSNNTGTSIEPCLGAVGNASGTYSSYLYGNETLHNLRLHDPTVPLFIYLAWNNVHAPNEAPQNYLDMHKNISNSARQALAAMMSALDDQLTSVIDAFKDKGMWDNTFMIFTTDNGGNLGGSGINYPLRGGKYTFWQGGCRAVSFISGGLIPATFRGSSWNGAAHAADWYTTVAALAGADVTSSGPLPPDGVNLYAAMTSNASSPRTEVVLQIVSTDNGNNFELPPKEYCDSNPIESPHCDLPRVPTPARPFPLVTKCNESVKSQQWTADTLYNGSFCLMSSSQLCLNVQRSGDNVILFRNTAPPGDNEIFHIRNGQLRTALGDQCVVASSERSQLKLGPCSSEGAAGWSFNSKTGQILYTNASDNSMNCVDVSMAGGNGNSSSGLQIGVLIQDNWKLIVGYPGWRPDWDGWIQPPNSDAESSALENGWTSSNGTFCDPVPCLFDIFADPTEHNDVQADHPDIVQSMHARLLELQKGEVTLADSGLCPTPAGTGIDEGCANLANRLGFWEPWLPPI